jgi:hypothetical protein
MSRMTTTAPEVVIRALVNDSGLRSVAEIIVVFCLVALLLEREMVRHRPGMWARSAARNLTALAVPLGIAWAVIAVRRFIELAGG